ncbi:MAG: vWA domain-containing protein [Rubripirellula sp.]
MRSGLTFVILPGVIVLTCVSAASNSGLSADEPAGQETVNEAAVETADAENRMPTVESSAAASAMATIFSPARAPKQKTMGLLQRSFLDLASQGDQELEVAVVVDGTDSMASELAGVQRTIHQMLGDLKQYRNNEVRAAIVVYRDAGSPSGDVVIPLPRFSSNREEIDRAVEALTPESGAPFFHELPDLGLHHAITELPWSEDDQVAKWILMFGDAPPYAESFVDAETPEAYRRYATSILVSMAKQKNIRINCVLCTSSDGVVEAYDKAIDQTRRFMNELSSGTDGLMLDLSYEAIRTAMVDAARQPETPLTKIEPITAIDLAAVRRDSGSTQEVKQVRLAVIPHMPLDKISFDVRHPAVRVSTALRNKFASVPGVRVASPRDIKEQLRRLRSEGLSREQAMRGLAARLGVDFVVWGSLDVGQATMQTAAYRRDDGQPVVPVKLDHRDDSMAYALIKASAKNAPEDQALSHLMSHMGSLQSELNVSLAESDATRDEILSAMEALEHALAFDTGSEDANEYLESADRASRAAITAEPTNALAHWLQANVAYNQAANRFRLGDRQAAAKRMNEMRSSLGEAVKHRQNLTMPGLMTEIEADYYLLMRREADNAIERYKQLVKLEQPSQSQLRGHWMLAGIYAGDWGVAGQDVVDVDQARYHITQVLANWPESPEASLLKQWLRWDESTQETEFNYLPIIHSL